MIAGMTDPALAFHQFERAGWQDVAERYHRAWGALTSQAIPPLLDAAGVRAGVRVLDIACGPGYASAAARGRGAEVVAVDFAAAMLELARVNGPGLDARVGDAEELPFEDGSFDAAVMNFGLLHLGRPEEALREMHRVVRPGGRAGFTVWAPPEEAVGFGIVLRAVERHGKLDVPLPPGPPFFRFSDPAECRRALGEAGFVRITVIRQPQTWRVSSPEAFFEIMQHATVRTAALLRAQTREALGAIGRAIQEAGEPYRAGDGLELPMPAVVAAGVRRGEGVSTSMPG